MKRVKFMMMAAASILCFAFTGCSSDDDPNPAPNDRYDIELSRVDGDIVDAQKTFAFKMLNNIASEESENIIISPMSVFADISMFANGADKETLAETAKDLGASSIDELNSLNSRLSTQLMAIDRTVNFTMANSAWINPEYEFLPNFSAMLKQYYNAESNFADLGSWKASIKSTNGALLPPTAWFPSFSTLQRLFLTPF